MNLVDLVGKLDLKGGQLEGAAVLRRSLSDLAGVFADTKAYAAVRAQSDPLVYSVSSFERPEGAGQLHYGLGRLMPGRIGAEYYLTKGHLHAWRPAAEVYLGLRGRGALLLEKEGEGLLCPLEESSVVYVPGDTAHRTVNTGDEPLLYLGIYPAAAGHDYASIATNNFRHVVIERRGRPVLVLRSEFLP